MGNFQTIVASTVLGLAAFSPMSIDAEAAVTAVTVSSVNMRAGPSTSYPSVAVVPGGSTVTTYGCQDDYSWCDVAYGSSRGWVSASGLQTTYNGQTSTFTPALAAAIGISVIAFNQAYWNRYYRNYPWYGDWNRYYRGPVGGRHGGPTEVRRGRVEGPHGGEAKGGAIVGPEGNRVRGGKVTGPEGNTVRGGAACGPHGCKRRVVGPEGNVRGGGRERGGEREHRR
ncbi:SH3 domain-containing protein [Flexibacterium corallicola]|uniref:SH3 domain-containing protein n=1 Tax=Flexibacterium corallicola TaxID=3037259 RepID=UPI00286F5D4D|nr:SH3 domain-containing protein [Pseudovibrio sp. M1P-2-3]